MRHDRSRSRSLWVLLAGVLVLAAGAGVFPAGAAAADSAVRVYASTVTFGSAEATEAAIANGSAAPTDELVLGDTLVVVIESDRLATAMAAANGSTTDRFLAVLTGNASFRLRQTNPTPMKNAKTAVLGRRNLTVYRDAATTYVLIATGDLAFRYRTTNHSARIYGGERFAVEFGYDLPESPRNEGPEGPVIELHPVTAGFDTTGYWYAPLAPERVTVSLEVNVEPDDDVLVRATLDDGRTIARRLDPGEIPGHQTVQLDLRGVEPGTDYDLALVHDGAVVDRIAGTVREPRAVLENATLTEVGNQTAVAVTARLSHGGKVEVLDASCDVVGVAWLAPGVERRLTIELWSGGERVTAGAESGYGVLIRAVRDRGAGGAGYPGDPADATLQFDDRTCPPATGRSTTTATPATTTTGTIPSTTGSRPPTTTAEEETATVRSPGQPGLTAASWLVGLVVLVLLRRIRA